MSNKDIDIELRPNGVLWNYLYSFAQSETTNTTCMIEAAVPLTLSSLTSFTSSLISHGHTADDVITTVNTENTAVDIKLDAKNTHKYLRSNGDEMANITSTKVPTPTYTTRPSYISPMIAIIQHQQNQQI